MSKSRAEYEAEIECIDRKLELMTRLISGLSTREKKEALEHCLQLGHFEFEGLIDQIETEELKEFWS